MRAVLLAVDPATSSGWSIFEVADRFMAEGALVRHGVIRNTSGAEIAAIVALAEKMARDNGVPLLAVVEDQFLNRSVSSMKHVVRISGAWMGALQAAGVDNVEFLQPSAWQAAVLRVTSRTKGMKRASLKATAHLVVRETFGVSVGEDEADAICIGRYQSARV